MEGSVHGGLQLSGSSADADMGRCVDKNALIQTAGMGI